MKKIAIAIVIGLCFGALDAAVSRAQGISQYPLTDFSHRLSMDAGVNQVWRTAPIGTEIPGNHEFTAGVYAAYQIVDSIALMGSGVLGLDSKLFEGSVGLRLHILRAKR